MAVDDVNKLKTETYFLIATEYHIQSIPRSQNIDKIFARNPSL